MESVRAEKTQAQPPQHQHLIYFIERPDHSWWDVFTREGFRHCFLLTWDEWSNRWLLVDWRRARLDLNIMFDFEAEKLMREIDRLKGTVVAHPGMPDVNGDGPLLTYCVNFVARWLGINSWWVLTPYRLYRRLLATGGEVVYSWRRDRGTSSEETTGQTSQDVGEVAKDATRKSQSEKEHASVTEEG